MHDELRSAAKDLIHQCGCQAGCPSCAGPALEIGEYGKSGALRLLEFVSGI
jgi:DEAD/DEAH box helicase domain-containing protein